MFSSRLFALVLCQTLAVAAGAALWDWAGAVGGALLGAWLWLAWESWHAARALAWLHAQNLSAPPVGLSAVWARTLRHARRWLRDVQAECAQAQQRVQDVLSALDASPNGLILVDDGLIAWCNRTACTHWRLDVARDRGQRIGHLLREPAFTRWWQAGDFSGAPLALTMPARTGGDALQLAVQAHAWGTGGRYLLLSRDVTAFEHGQAQRRQFVANVSHELRTPLTVLVGFIETLQTLELSEGQRSHFLTLMQQQAQRMTHLVEDLLTLSRLEGSPAPGLEERTTVAALLGACEQEARALSAQICGTGSAGHTLHFPQAGDAGMDWHLAGRASELMSAISNLLSNAIRYTPAGGAVTLSWQPQPDGSATLAVRDTGPGIAPEHLPRLTERFYRVDHSRSRDSGGTGLGLAIVKHALQRHDAQLRITSQLGAGATFTVTFPAARLFAPATGAQAAASASSFAAASCGAATSSVPSASSGTAPTHLGL